MIIPIITNVLLYLNFQFFNWNVLNVILFLVWWVSTAKLANHFLQKIFDVNKSYSNMLGYFLSIFVLGFITNIFTAWLALNDHTILASLILTTLILWWWQKRFRKESGIRNQELEIEDKPVFRQMPVSLLMLILTILIVAGGSLVYMAKTGNYILTPWQVLSGWYVLVVVLLLLLVYFVVFTKNKTKLILFAIIISSLLLHSYLLVYQTGFGGDRWRHVGSEYRLLREVEYQPTLLTDNMWYREYAGIKIPRALIDAPKLSYGFQWSTGVIAAKVTGLDVNELDKYLGILIWSIFLPVILFIGALQIWPNKQFALLTATIPNLFFILQYYGAQTLPITYGGLALAFVIALWLSYLRISTTPGLEADPSLVRRGKIKKIAVLAIFFSALMYFGYSLAFILAVMVGLLIWILGWKRPWRYLGVGILSLIIFGLEIVSGVNNLDWNLLSLKRFLTHLLRESHLFYHDIGLWQLGNFIWSRRLSEIVALVFVLMLLVFLWQIIRSKNKLLQFLAWGWLVLMINFLLSWNLLTGLHYLSRRLDIFIVLIMLMIFTWGIIHNLPKKKSLVGLSIIILAIASTITYITGPREIAIVTADEAAATEYMWLETAYTPRGYCALANTWPLLALEAWSGKEIVLGNFPHNFNHQQPERVALFDKINQNPAREDLTEALRLAQKEFCFLMLDSTVAQPEAIEYFEDLLGRPKVFGDNLVWRF